MPKQLLITNCKRFDTREAVSVLIEDGTIAKIGQIKSAGFENVLDTKGMTVAPGFIDVHIQGAGGADTLDATPQALQTISRTCARFGVTGFLATTVYRPNGDKRHIEVAAEMTGRSLGGANLLGIHLEGPFISPKRRGMIQPDCVCEPSDAKLDEILDVTKGRLRMMTVAPELPGGLEIIQRLTQQGIVASFGHSEATYEQTLAGFDAGISHVTHCFNAMPSIHHRSPGPLVAIFETGKVICQVIADGVHIHPAVLKLTFEKLGAERVIVITDGIQALGLPDGKYVYNSVEYESKAGTPRYKDGTLIGTAIGLNELLKRLMAFTGCGIETAIRTVTENPARVLGIAGRKGFLAAGKDADIALFDGKMTVQMTIVAGEIVFQKE
jgi:N-acetylglucosamine-6-phosphate deacetylase